jgi:hypothetical protein
MPEIIVLTPYLITFWIAGTFFSSSRKKNNSLHFFTFPVTAVERIIHSVLVVLVVAATMHLLSLAGSYIGYYLIHPLLDTNMNDIRWAINGKQSILEQQLMSLETCLYYLAAIFGFLFASLYFKKNAMLKAIASVAVLFGIIAIVVHFTGLEYIMMPVDKHFPLSVTLNGVNRVGIIHYVMWFKYGWLYQLVLPCVGTVFFWSLSYLRLRETEV